MSVHVSTSDISWRTFAVITFFAFQYLPSVTSDSLTLNQMAHIEKEEQI